MNCEDWNIDTIKESQYAKYKNFQYNITSSFKKVSHNMIQKPYYKLRPS